MQDLNDLYYFSIVVEKGGFAAAGRALNIPKSRLSRRIAQLEERLGARLLQRSTRRFAITDVGQRFYQHCQTAIAEAQAAEEVVAECINAPRGIVRISCPVSFTQNVMSAILPEFCAKYPQVRVQMLSTNRRIDLINEGVDVALRVRAKLDTDAELVVRTFGRSDQWLVASPSYLAEHGRPEHPDDLARHTTLSFAEAENQGWELTATDGEVRRVEVQPRLMCSDFPLSLASAIAGLGISLLPEGVCTPAIAEGKLERLLPGWKLPDGIVHCVYPSRRGLLPAVRALIDWLVEEMPAMIEAGRV